MRVFLDTEYTNPSDRELISIGMVSEDGKQQLYIERSDFPTVQCSVFVVKHVLPQLGESPQNVVPLHDLGCRLSNWFLDLPRSVRIAADSSIDLMLLRRSLGSDPPNLNLTLYDLRPLIDTPTYHEAVERFYREKHRPRHHAMHDALAHRQGFLAWAEERKRGNQNNGSAR